MKLVLDFMSFRFRDRWGYTLWDIENLRSGARRETLLPVLSMICPNTEE